MPGHSFSFLRWTGGFLRRASPGLDAVDADDGSLALSDHGRLVWDNLVRDYQQVFLSINGHFWLTGRLTQANAVGQSVELHLANFQQHCFGEAGAVRLYRFELGRGVVDVSTEVPYIGSHDLKIARARGGASHGEIRPFLVRSTTRLWAPAHLAPRPAASLVIPEAEAYWRFEGSGSLAPGDKVEVATGRGNTLVVAGPSTSPLTFANDNHRSQPSQSSLRCTGTKDTGAYLRTIDSAAINSGSSGSGYTREAFFRLPEPFTGESAWSALISRRVSAKTVGRAIGTVNEPAATLSISGGRELQWCVHPIDLNRSTTNWGHELRTTR